MKSSEIKIGETYLFVATDSPTRKHLEGQPFEVTEKRRVWRRVKGKRANVYRFFDQLGHAAMAEELEPIICVEAKEEAVGWLKPAENGFEAMIIYSGGHPANPQPSDYKNEDGLPF